MSTNKLMTSPSLQHLVKNIGPSPTDTAANILKPIRTVRVIEANNYVRARLNGMAPEKVFEAASKDPRPAIRKTACEVLPLIEQYLLDFETGWFKPLPPVFHQISPSVQIPIKPLGIMKVDGQPVVIWPQLWKLTSLTAEQFNIFASYLKYGLLDKFPDYEDFHWLEMSVPKGRKSRELRVRSLETASILSKEELLLIEENLEQALILVAEARKAEEKPTRKSDDDQGDLF